MRRLILVLFALSMVLVAPVHNARPVHAVSTACEVATDVADVVYTDWHNQTTATVSDSFPGGNPTHVIGIDLWFWRISTNRPFTNTQSCFRAAYGSAWSNDGSGGFWTGTIVTQVCGGNIFTWNSGTAGPNANRNDAETKDNWWGFGPQGVAPVIQRLVTLPSGVQSNLTFADFTAFPIENGCLPQANTTGMEASSSTWTPTVLHSNGQAQWYCHDHSPPGEVACP